ncbi:hypothetical protein ACHAXR_004263, partial [Thalassiosira sp. AJA248-18]
MAWIGGGPTRSLFASRRVLSIRPLNSNYVLAAAPYSSSSSDSINDERVMIANGSNNSNHNGELLQSKLRQLALLNGGKSINPRSPRQVSNLLYGNTSYGDNYGGSGSNNGGTNNGWKKKVPLMMGPTDKATLQQIILHDEEEGDYGEIEKQKEVAKLVLQCRELLSAASSSSSNNGKALSAESFASRAARGAEGRIRLNKEPSSLGVQHHQPLLKQQMTAIQVANFSNSASNSITSSTLDEADAIGELLEKESNNGDVQEEEIISLIDEDDDDTVIASALPPSSAYSSLSPYERMVMDLFPNIETNNVGNGDGGNDEEEDYTLDPYWMDPLLSLTKPSARSLVRQLKVGCPMGYDPSAGPVSSLISKNNNNTTTASAPPKRTTSLLSYIQTQKYHYFGDTVVLVRVGDFYECYGIDAILLVEYCGLNPMAGKARAGCPWRNVQSTLDGLTNGGLRVAVYEEWNGDDGELLSEDDGGGKKKPKGKKLKTRYLAQVVSSANPTYMHGLVLNDDSGNSLAADSSPAPHSGDISSSSPGRSYVGVIETSAGYTLVEVSAEERTAVVTERLTSEAVACRLVAYPPADPLFYVPPFENDGGGSGARKRRLDRLPFLPWRQTSSSSSPSLAHRLQMHGGGDIVTIGKVRVKTLPPSLVVGPRPGLTDVERAKQTIVTAFLRLEDDSISRTSIDNDDSTAAPSSSLSPLRRREQRRTVVTHDDFVIVASSSDSKNSVITEIITNPLHLETATQLGLMSESSIPPLISSLLPDSAPTSSRRFLRRWLLVPPPPEVADAMTHLVSTLKDGGNGDGGNSERALIPSLISGAPPLTGKVISLIRAGQASAAVYREILCALDAASEVLLLDTNEASSGIVNPLMKILYHDTGTTASDSASLRQSFLDAMQVIAGVVSTQNLERTLHSIDDCNNDSVERDYISYFGDVVPPAFFE